MRRRSWCRVADVPGMVADPDAAGAAAAATAATSGAESAARAASIASAGNAATSGAASVGAVACASSTGTASQPRYGRVTLGSEQRQRQRAAVDRHDPVAHAVQQREAGGCERAAEQQQRRRPSGNSSAPSRALSEQADAGPMVHSSDASGDLAGADQRGDAHRLGRVRPMPCSRVRTCTAIAEVMNQRTREEPAEAAPASAGRPGSAFGARPAAGVAEPRRRWRHQQPTIGRFTTSISAGVGQQQAAPAQRADQRGAQRPEHAAGETRDQGDAGDGRSGVLAQQAAGGGEGGIVQPHRHANADHGPARRTRPPDRGGRQQRLARRRSPRCWRAATPRPPCRSIQRPTRGAQAPVTSSAQENAPRTAQADAPSPRQPERRRWRADRTSSPRRASG